MRRLALFTFALFATTTALASAQTWHIDDTPLPTKITSLSPQRQRAILAALTPRIENDLDDGDKSELDPTELNEAKNSLHTLTVKDGNQSLIFVAGWDTELCGGVGNCTIWVLDGQHRVLLESGGKAITVLASHHHGRSDILVSAHDSASDTDRERYTFNGSVYVLSWCGTSTMGYPGHEYVHPHTFSHSCNR